MKINFTKRIFALFLTLLMVFSSVPMSVFAQEVITTVENTEATSQETVTEEITTEEITTEESTSEDTATETPEPSFDGTGVASADELESALASGAEKICVTADFEIDRTYYITYNVNIYSAEAHTLTRKADFAGDIFVVGEAADGTVCTEKVTLSVGTAEAANSDILTIDGNKDNMTVDVTGTVFFVCKNGQVDLQPDLTVKNCEKKGNVRALDTEKYTLCNSRTVIGGAVAIIAEAAKDDPKSIVDGIMNIYGGKYLNNGVVTSGLYGGAFFNHGKMYIYDGLFDGNYAERAGVLYNYRTSYIYKAMIQNNESTSMGGAIYLPASSGAIMYIGGDTAAESTQVVFKNNTSKTGGAISDSGKLIMRNTLFESNRSTSSAGAVYGNGTYVNIAAYNCEFKLNKAGVNGGAVYVTGQRSSYKVDLDIRDSKFAENEAGESGGAVYAAGKSRTYVRDTDFSKNTAASSGGVFYVHGSSAEFNYVTFTENSAGANGGVLCMVKGTEEAKDENGEKVTVDVPANVTMHKVTATKNSAKSNGGAAYCGKGSLKVYDSLFKNNSANAGSALCYFSGAEGDVYNCIFEENVCAETNASNSGTIYLYTGGTKVTLHTCTFTDNTSSGLGGAVMISGPSLADIYNITATGNSASKGGVFYITPSKTVVTLSGLTVSENTATTGGPIIWGNTANAKLYINKNNYTDSDVTTALDDAYWATAIANKLTVYDSDATVPEHDEYDQPDYDKTGSPDVKTAKQLEDAINAGFEKIRILKDFEIDRTYYVAKNVQIYSEIPVTLKRKADFAGDIFVVGENAEGTVSPEKVTLTVGTPGATTADMLTIDGNKENMTETVKGTVFFVGTNGQADLHPDLTVKNCEKKGNDRALDKEKYTLSGSPKNVGGAVGIIADVGTETGKIANAKGGIMNIYGGKYSDNGVSSSGVYGGAFFNHSKMYVYDGAFENGYASRAGAIYNYRTLYIYKASFENNSASSSGGAIYVPATSAGYLYIGQESAAPVVYFSSNSAEYGGAVYMAGGKLTADSTVFSQNSATLGGALYATGNYKTLAINKSLFDKNTSTENGSALYLTDGNTNEDRYILKATDTVFSENTATLSAAVYLKETSALLEGISFIGNTAAEDGGAIAFCENSEADMKNVTATGNSASRGGFAAVSSSKLRVFDSSISQNTAVSGGAMFLGEGAETGVYNTGFISNEATDNSGALDISSGVKVILQECTFDKNSAANYGGALRASSASPVDIYNVTATQNAAKQGGFMYETDAGTVVTLIGATVSGNTATDGGSVIWGNTNEATLNINKSKFTDSDITTEPDDAYWAGAIANELTVNYIDGDVPPYADFGNEEPGNMWNAVDVTSAEELETALAEGKAEIRITKDFEIDRTFYVTNDTVIFSTSYVTLTRKADFGGDIFVVGQASDGTVCDEQADLTVGNPDSKTKKLLTIDGNKNNMTADVKGTVFFVCANGHVNLYDNLTVKNCKKVGNERTLETVHGVSYPEYIGAAVGIIAKNATMNIYGGLYTANGANESGKTSYGGAFYNFGVMNIYGGTFSKNRAARAGVFYNYRTLNIYKADITENYASSNGGAIYMPASTGAFLYIGQDTGTEGFESKVLFKSNSSGGNAGAIYANNVAGIKNTTFESNKTSDNGGAISSNSAVLTVEDSEFISNTASDNGGAINSNSAVLTVKGSEFNSNTASDNGAAIYVSGKSSKENAVELTANNTTFTSNTATLNGGAVYMKSEAQAYVGACLFDKNTAKASTTDTRYGGGAVYMNGAEAEFEGTTFSANTSKYNGGAVVLNTVQKAVFTDIIADGNSADKDGGFLYAIASSPKFYGGEIKNGSAAENGGAFALENGCETDIIKASLKANSAVNGGALFVNTGDGRTLIHSSSLTENTATNGGAVMVTGGSLLELYNAEAIKNGASYGGVLYLSGDSSKARFNLITVSENTATVAGPIVYSDTAAAVLDINKDKFTDTDITTELDSAYWSSAIAGELTVQENDEKTPGYAEIGNESFGYLWDAVDVSTADELEAALTAGKPHIRVTADFDLDRTFTVRSDAVIFSTKAHKLTRAAGFGGVIFAVTTESADKTTVFSLGNSVSETENLLTIDGNKDNMTVEVTGAVIDVQEGTKAEIYKNITLTSCSATPITNRGEAEINGGIFTKNTSAANGGVIYNEGTLVISAGEFTSNTALNGGAVYNAGALTAEGGAFTSNKAQTNGGAICNTGTLNIGKAAFTSNNATENGGAIATDKTLTADEAVFTSNKAKIGGAIYIAPAADKTASLIITSAVFSKNTAEKGGAVGAERAKLTVTADFEKNTATNGGAVYMFSGCDGDFTGVSSVSDSAKENGGFLYFEGSAASFLDCTVDSASAVKSGAAAYIGNGGSLDVISSEFIGGNAQANGGAIALYGETATAQIDKSKFDGNSAVNGGAVYKNDGGQLVITDSSFEACTATNGGAVYSDNGETKVSSSEFISNVAQNNGGAIAFERKATATLYGVTAESNNAENSGGFLYTEDTVLSLEYSDINSNTAKKGGALALEGDTVLECAESGFVGNRANADGGAVYVKTDGTTVNFNKCSLTSNIATGNGGAFYICSGSEAELYNTTATKNEAAYGAVLYITNTSTEVIVNGMTVSGNRAGKSGYIIYGNSLMAVLRINKENHTDKDEKGPLNDAYWSKAIAGSIKVKEMSDKAPDYSKTVVNVKTAAELEAAINKDAKNICIIADFEIDRTYYIKSDVTIYSTEPHTLTRAENFGGDFFVVGETSEGSLAYLGSRVVKLTVGHPLSEKENLLIIDGNKDNMKTTVSGSIFFVSYGAHVELNDNLTVTNCYKQFNERAHIPEYKLSRPNRVGGSVAIIANGMLTVNGGNYKYNRVNDEDTSSEEGRNSSIGGVFYNNSNLIVRGGNFIGNQAGRGGIVYNYKIVKFIAGTFRDNAAKYSAVYYSPSSAGIHLLIGSYDEDGEKVLFKNNTSKYGGSVVTSSHYSAVVVFGNASFKNNTVTSGNGGVISTTSTLTIKNSEFIGNKASGYGGAVYFSRSNNDEITRLGNIENCLFESNQAKNGGAVATNSSAAKTYSKGSISTIEGCTFRDNLSTSSGGAFYSDNLSKVTVDNCLFEKNKSNGEAGAMYTIGKSNLTLNNNRFIGNTAASHGGAISARSVTLKLNGNEISGNTAKSNGGAIYVSYSSAMDINTHLTLDGTVIKNNQASSGGAIYATRRSAIEENAILINAKNAVFEGNTAKSSGGALLLTAGIKTYFNNITFNKNSAKNGGAVSVGSKSLFELDKATFTSNTSTGNGGALSLGGSGTALMNNVSTSGNKGSSGGFVYSEGGILKLYNSKINGNTAYSGGAMYLYTGAVSNIYNTEFNNNKTYLSASGSTGNGGALFVYTGGAQTLLHTCKFADNETTGTGGAMYVSGESNAKFYNLTASGNKAVKGGFMYETKAGTVVDIVGLTVSGNSASDGGPIIWGNTLNAVLNLDKSKYSDTKADVSAADYWSEAIVNKLTVKDISSEVVKADTYVGKKEETKPAVTKDPVSVEDVFNIAKKSSDADINANYNKLKKLDNSSNLMSRSTAKYPNINGKTVMVDTFVYPTKGKAHNGIAGLGILLYQSLLYKKANPKEEVYIDISSYRFSVQSAVNLNRNGRYFGYMRDLVGKEYDEYGFVRLAYLLITAAKMGIHVNVIGHIDAYPRTKTEPTFYQYFTRKLSDPCDPKYAKGKVIGDYLDFNQTDWTLDAKGGTDMMHTKMAAVSHYLDMNGVAHRNAVWSSSSNLDGVKADGQNANWKLQTALIITNHDEIYRVTTNYLRLISSLTGQEEIIEFQDIVNSRSTEQIDLINAGRGKEIPADEQLVYIGTSKDDIFELYFTPFGGSVAAWDEVYNPYCKYLREMYESEDYILFAYNAAEYSGRFVFGRQLEQMIIRSFHENRDVRNKIYSYMEGFDSTTFDDLVVGKDIGYKSFFEKPFGTVHNKDMQLSYVKDGQRYFVTLHNSLNFHSGSMSYQSNFMIVIKEKSCAENGVFSTIAKYSVGGDIAAHTYSDIKTVKATSKKDGYTYRECIYCKDTIVFDTVHKAGDWIVSKKATETENGVRYKKCVVCSDIVNTEEIARKEKSVDIAGLTGREFSEKSYVSVDSAKVPLTIEATVRIPENVDGRTGVIVGNYSKSGKSIINIEGAEKGRIRLYIKNGKKVFDYTFKKDIRSDEPVDIAVVFSSGKAILYVNGTKTESVTLKVSLPATVTGLRIGGDNRSGNIQYFKGRIYAAHLFSKVRSASNIKKDRLVVSPDASNLIYSGYYTDSKLKSIPVTTELVARTFSAKNRIKLKGNLPSTPKTIEAKIFLPKSVKGRGGVIFGNYAESFKSPLNLEIYTEGRVRLYFRNKGKVVSHIFKTDIRTQYSAVDIAVTLSGKKAVLYVNGEKKETAKLAASVPTATKKFCIGGDNRKNNSAYFKGKIYSVNVFSDVRTNAELRRDAIVVSDSETKLMYSGYIANTDETAKKVILKGQTFAEDVRYTLPGKFKKTPHTIEATIQLSNKISGEGGVIFGNYTGKSGNELNLSVVEKGRIKLYFKTGNTKVSHIFKTDIRTQYSAVNIAVTIKDKTATLFINGVKKETAKLKKALPTVTGNFCIGGDNRKGNSKYFKGKIYSVNVFSDVRTDSEIRRDMRAVIGTTKDKALLYSGYFYGHRCDLATIGKSHSEGSLKKRFSATSSECGAKNKECTVCGKNLEAVEIKKTKTKLNSVDYTAYTGRTFDENSGTVSVANKLPGGDFTIEAMVHLSPEQTERAGTIIGNYDGGESDQLNIEAYTDGKIRLYYKVDGKAYTHTFKTDIRAKNKAHITLSVSGKQVDFYVNGTLKETYKAKKDLSVAFDNLKIGGDNRAGGNYFAGQIYSVYIFDGARNKNQISVDCFVVPYAEQNTLYSMFFK